MDRLIEEIQQELTVHWIRFRNWPGSCIHRRYSVQRDDPVCFDHQQMDAYQWLMVFQPWHLYGSRQPFRRPWTKMNKPSWEYWFVWFIIGLTIILFSFTHSENVSNFANVADLKVARWNRANQQAGTVWLCGFCANLTDSFDTRHQNQFILLSLALGVSVIGDFLEWDFRWALIGERIFLIASSVVLFSNNNLPMELSLLRNQTEWLRRTVAETLVQSNHLISSLISPEVEFR